MNATTMPDLITGDWLDGRAYPARIVGRWNGWAVPLVDRPTAERLLADMAEMRDPADEDSDTLTWDGDVIVRHSPCYADEDGYEDDRLGPDSEGLYAIGFDWCWWSPVDDA